MTICARADGRTINECTRDVRGCQCAQELIDIAGRIAYPRRGSADETATAVDFAEEIQRSNEPSAFRC